MKTIAEIQKARAEIITAMIDKGFVTPDCRFTINDTYMLILQCHHKTGPRLNQHNDISYNYMEYVHADTPQKAFKSAHAHILAIPDPETAAIQKYVNGLADAVDQGRADGIPSEYTDPVSVTIKAVYASLLPAPGANT